MIPQYQKSYCNLLRTYPFLMNLMGVSQTSVPATLLIDVSVEMKTDLISEEDCYPKIIVHSIML